MDPVEPESAITRLERTLWTVWCYITEAFDRVFRPPPADDNGLNSLQDSAGDGAPLEGGGAQAGTTGAPSPSLQDDSGEVCTEDAALRHGESSMLNRSNEGQKSREEEFDPTGNDEAGLFLTKAHENKQHKRETEKFGTGGGIEVSKMDEENEVAGSESPGEVVTEEDMEESDGEVCAEEEDQNPDARDGHQQMDEPATEDRGEGFEAKDGEIKVRSFIDKSPEEEHQILEEHGNNNEVTGLEQDKNDELLQTKLLEDVRIKATENQTAAEEPKMENRNSVADDRQEEDLLDQFVASSQEDIQTTVVAHKEEDVVVTYVQNTAETEIILSEISKFVDGDCLEEERLASEVNNKGVTVKKVSTVTPDMGKPESESVQEISGEFRNIPMWLIEGQGVVLQERNPQACKEVQEGVPELNNEFQPDENTTQRFHEGGNCQEIQITQLPEEVENKVEESLKNSRTIADSLLMKEVKQAGEENSLYLDVEQHRAFEEPIPQEANLESEHLYAKKETGEESSMKTEIKPFHEEFETYTDSADEADELQDGTDFGIDGVSIDSRETPGCEWESLEGVAANERKGFTNETLKFTETKVEKKDMRFCQDFLSNAESSPEEVSTCELWKEPEHTSLDDSIVKMENMSIDAEEEEEVDVQVRCESVCLEVEATAGERTAITELSASSKIQESENQSQDKALEMNERTKADTDDKLKTSEPNDLPELLSETMEDVIQSENICEPIKGHQDVIDEDILDLWIETAMSEDFHDTELRKSKPSDLLEEEPGEMYPKETEQFVESNSGELVIDSDTSSAVDSGILPWSLSSGSLQDNRDICAASPDFPAQNFETPEGADRHLEVEDLIEMRSDTDSGVSSPYQELERHQERMDEELGDREVEMNVCGDKDFGSPEIKTELSQVGDEPVEMCFSDSLDGIKLSESEQQLGWIEDSTEPLHQDMLVQNQSQVDSPALDFASQKSRIAVKNRRVRPPTNPRTLLQKPSADPTPPVHAPVKGIPGVPLGGLGIGFKLPGLGSGFPVLKKRQQADVADEDEPKAQPQEPEKSEEEKRDASQPDVEPQRPKWKPPGHLGFGNPLMSELKTKLKKTT
ncbi:hypothetical protein OJAV_G00189740 [Oryzias javanicus]|uniref:Uncharacterized protein n=1 Tax=Oryzias javanicus TaxID=123683 RepID=A0A3S2PF51_ORYJA|nr:hypothetical protein OJAV_G00189740 [Oryzias javanicus]